MKSVMVLMQSFDSIKQGRNTFEWQIPPGFLADGHYPPYLLFADVPGDRIHPDSWHITNSHIVAVWDAIEDIPLRGVAYAPVTHD